MGIPRPVCTLVRRCSHLWKGSQILVFLPPLLEATPFPVPKYWRTGPGGQAWCPAPGEPTGTTFY